MNRWSVPRIGSVLAWILLTNGLPFRSNGMTTNVSIGNDFFSPSTVSIQANDSVKWTWAAGSHSTTSSTGLWNSGVLSTGATFTNTFLSAGTFNYICTVHGNMVGAVHVAAAVNQPPSVSITNPVSGAVFAAPWTGVIRATAMDSDGTVTNVQFFNGTTSLGRASSAPFNLTVSNLAAGSYSLKAVASDNAGATNTSAIVTVSVVTPVAMTLSNPQRLSASQFRFNYNANTGLQYVVQRATTLPNFIGLSTNTATSTSINVTDVTATATSAFYRVGRRPNP